MSDGNSITGLHIRQRLRNALGGSEALKKAAAAAELPQVKQLLLSGISVPPELLEAELDDGVAEALEQWLHNADACRSWWKFCCAFDAQAGCTTAAGRFSLGDSTPAYKYWAAYLRSGGSGTAGLIEQCRDGIPDTLRSKVWMQLALPAIQESAARQCGYQIRGLPDLLQTFHAMLALDEQLIGGVVHEIEKDLDRSGLRGDDTAGEAALRRVLIAFAQWNRGNQEAVVGYCQGMNFIAVELLSAMRHDHEVEAEAEAEAEARAFWLLVAIVEQFFPRNYAAGKSMLGVQVHTRLLTDVIAARLPPELQGRMDSLFVTTPLLATRWVLSLFACPSQSAPGSAAAEGSILVRRVWDLLFGLTHLSLVQSKAAAPPPAAAPAAPTSASSIAASRVILGTALAVLDTHIDALLDTERVTTMQSFSACLAPFNPFPLPAPTSPSYPKYGTGSADDADDSGDSGTDVDGFMQCVWRHMVWLNSAHLSVGWEYHADCVGRQMRELQRLREARTGAGAGAGAGASSPEPESNRERERESERRAAPSKAASADGGRTLLREAFQSGDGAEAGATSTWRELAGRSGGGEEYRVGDMLRTAGTVTSSAIGKAVRAGAGAGMDVGRGIGMGLGMGTGMGVGRTGGEQRTIPSEAEQATWPVVKQGWLAKRGQVVRNWKRRFFVLRQAPLPDPDADLSPAQAAGLGAAVVGGVLEYYDAEVDSRAATKRGAVLLSYRSACRACAVGELANSNPDSLLIEEVRGRGRALLVTAPGGARERSAWIKAVCGVLRRHAQALKKLEKSRERRRQEEPQEQQGGQGQAHDAV